MAAQSKPVILLASSPEHELDVAKNYVTANGGICAAFTRNHPITPKKVTLFMLLECLAKKDVMALKEAMATAMASTAMASWIMRHQMQHQWKLVWKGRISQALETMESLHPGKQLNALAIKGGPMCDWELEQLSPGGEIWKLFPGINLIIFRDATELVQALDDGKLDFYAQVSGSLEMFRDRRKESSS